jgi:hypothetical protein
MSTTLVSKRWVGVALLIAFFSLFAVTDLQARTAELVAIAPAAPCEFNELDEDPYMFLDDADASCAAAAVSDIHSADLFGSVAGLRVIEEGELKLHVYVQTDTGWERLRHWSSDDGYWEELRELENAIRMGEQAVASSAQFTTLLPATGRSYDEAYWDRDTRIEEEIDSFSQGRTADVSKLIADLTGETGALEADAYWGYLYALETSETDREELRELENAIRMGEQAVASTTQLPATSRSYDEVYWDAQTEEEFDFFSQGRMADVSELIADLTGETGALEADAYWGYLYALETSETD